MPYPKITNFNLFYNISYYSVSCALSAALAPVGTNRHRPAQTGTGTYRHRPDWTGTDRPGLFYDVFDKNFVLNSPNRHDILKIPIKNVIKQPGPVWAGRCRLLPMKGRKKRCI
jgi:hypothetical protein